MPDKQWTMNCILAGAEVADLLLAGEEQRAREVLTNLTSELKPEDVDYLLQRLKTEV
ncbi:hypothetical protein ES703_06396 [subsurface metagenome]